MQDDQLLKEALKKYKKSNYYVQSWGEYNEKIEEEWEIVELKQHKYANLEKIISQSPLVATFDL